MSAEITPLVSVVMANRNGAQFLDAAISSVLGQSLASLELLVVDDASTDESAEVLSAAAARDPRVRPIYCETPVGVGAARNLALDAAVGRYVAVVDADDLVHPNRFSRLVDYADVESACLVADDLIHFGTLGAKPERLFGDARFNTPTLVSLSELLDDRLMGGANNLGYIKPLIRRSALRDLRYRDDLPVGEDFDLLLRFAATGKRLHLLPEAWYLYRRHTGSLSHRLSGDAAHAMVRAMHSFRDIYGPDAPQVAAKLSNRIQRLEECARLSTVIDDIKHRRYGTATVRSLNQPKVIPGVSKSLFEALRKRVGTRASAVSPLRPLVLVAPEVDAPSIPESWEVLQLSSLAEMTSDARAHLTASTADLTRPVLSYGDLPGEFAGFIPNIERVQQFLPPAGDPPLVHVRTPTYKRPDMLCRALKGLQAQTLAHWICDVFDDDPDQTGASVVADLNDPRIRYHANRPQRLASRNIDQCFTRFNPHGAQYFYVLEDDNQILPRFLEDNIALCETHDVSVVLRNQLVEFGSGTSEARLSDEGLLQAKLSEGRCPPDVLHLCVMADMGVSNGGLFWSENALSDLEIGVECNATLQEYLRTIAIVEPVYVALEPLAVWAENGAQTVRNMGDRAGWLRRELNLKRSVQIVQRKVWARTALKTRRTFLNMPGLRYPADMRAIGMVKSLSDVRVGSVLTRRRVAQLVLRGMAIRLAGRPMRGLKRFIRDRAAAHPLSVGDARP